jgi:hypothetical protein
LHENGRYRLTHPRTVPISDDDPEMVKDRAEIPDGPTTLREIQATGWSNSTIDINSEVYMVRDAVWAKAGMEPFAQARLAAINFLIERSLPENLRALQPSALKMHAGNGAASFRNRSEAEAQIEKLDAEIAAARERLEQVSGLPRSAAELIAEAHRQIDAMPRLALGRMKKWLQRLLDRLACWSPPPPRERALPRRSSFMTTQDRPPALSAYHHLGPMLHDNPKCEGPPRRVLGPKPYQRAPSSRPRSPFRKLLKMNDDTTGMPPPRE